MAACLLVNDFERRYADTTFWVDGGAGTDDVLGDGRDAVGVCADGRVFTAGPGICVQSTNDQSNHGASAI